MEKKILGFINLQEKLEKTNSDKKMYHTHTVTGWIYCRQAWGGQELRNYIAIHDIWSLNLFLRCRCKMNGYANLISRKYSAPKINFHSIRHESWIALATLGEIRQGNTEFRTFRFILGLYHLYFHFVCLFVWSEIESMRQAWGFGRNTTFTSKITFQFQTRFVMNPE